MPDWLALRPSQLALRPRGPEEQTYGQTDGRTDVGNFSPFYRTLSTIGATAQKGPMHGKMKVDLKQCYIHGKMKVDMKPGCIHRIVKVIETAK